MAHWLIRIVHINYSITPIPTIAAIVSINMRINLAMPWPYCHLH